MVEPPRLDKGCPERVAFVATSYPRDPDDPAGHFVRAEALACAAGGARVFVVAPEPWAGDASVSARSAGGAGLFGWPGAAARLGAAPWRAVFAGPFAASAMRALADARPDRVVAHWLVPAAFPLAEAARSARLEVVCHGADVRLLVAMPTYVRRAIVMRVAARAERIRFVAESLRSELFASLDPVARASLEAIAVVSRPMVDITDAAPAEASERPYAIVSSRLVATKRVGLAVDAAARAGIDLVVVGDGPELEALSAMRSSARFLARLGRRATLGWVRGASALLHPSAVDAAPTSVLEARAFGVPVISCGAGDVARWAERDAGIVIAAPDASSIARAIARAAA